MYISPPNATIKADMTQCSRYAECRTPAPTIKIAIAPYAPSNLIPLVHTQIGIVLYTRMRPQPGSQRQGGGAFHEKRAA